LAIGAGLVICFGSDWPILGGLGFVLSIFIWVLDEIQSRTAIRDIARNLDVINSFEKNRDSILSSLERHAFSAMRLPKAKLKRQEAISVIKIALESLSAQYEWLLSTAETNLIRDALDCLNLSDFPSVRFNNIMISLLAKIKSKRWYEK
jgi:hypothetical protein